LDEESVAVEEISRLELLEDGTAVHVEGNLSWFAERGYGDRRQDGRWSFSMVETLYLVKNNKAAVYRKGVQLSFNELLSTYIKLDGNVWRDYVIYMDLRKRRYVVKEGYRPKLRFRVLKEGRMGRSRQNTLSYRFMRGKTSRWRSFYRF
jgi:tRNA splicing endonuclease